MQRVSSSAAVSGRCSRLLGPALGALLGLGACGDQTRTQAATDSVVRPASATALVVEAKPEPVLPTTEAEIPSGVSPPELSQEEVAAQEPAEDAPEAPNAALAAPPKAAAPAKAQPARPAKKREQPAPRAAASASLRNKPLAPSRPAPQPTAAAQPALPAPDPVPVATPQPRRVSVLVPSTDHVRVDVPPGLQAWLDADDRMRPWLGKAIAVADGCYAKVLADNPRAFGEIAVQLTMHPNARPSGRVASVSPAVSGLVMCATTRMLGIKMPLFTGTEGDSYTVRVHFTP